MEQKRTGLSYVFTLARDERGKLGAGMFLAVLCSALSFVPYLTVYQILLLIIKGEVTFGAMVMWACIGVGAAILQAALMSVAGICSHVAAFNTMHKIKVSVLEHMSRFNLGFFQEHAPGQIKTTLFDDVDRIENFLAHSLLELAQAIVVPLMMFIFMLRLHWIMALVMLIPMLLGIAVPMILMGNYPDMSTELAEDTEKLNASANEFITAMPVIKMYHLTAEKFEQYRDALQLYTTCWKKMCVSSCNPLSIALVILDSAILFTLPVGGWLFLHGSLPAASYLLFILLTMCFFASFLNLVTIVMQSMELGSGLDNIKKIMDMQEMKSGSKTLKKEGCYGIDFENVIFNYTGGGKDALSAVDIHLEPGSINAFVGPSGAGKTTAVQLLGRYWDVTGGSIKIGGVPVTELQTENLMDLTAFVFQDVFLLEDSLLENIRMGTNATKEQVRKAAQAAQIDDFIMSLPKGYETKIGDEGVKLSGGQQQRISIARAILKDAPIVVFDEATSYSDIENEHKIQLALQNLLKGKTTIMIAHRLHTIRDADKIVVFVNGTVAEQGTHKALVEKGGMYAEMWDTYTKATLGKEAV
jgi:ATP-binding cassette subfamily B protein IrtA